jgi:hypothetical protein
MPAPIPKATSVRGSSVRGASGGPLFRRAPDRALRSPREHDEMERAPKRDAHALHGRCDLICPDLPKVL